ncbi:MAG: substrate-binding domain-containing protein [Myxococcales bacterium]|nr:substrate-binding domain-containing protein [Myxococcales bacterium]
MSHFRSPLLIGLTGLALLACDSASRDEAAAPTAKDARPSPAEAYVVESADARTGSVDAPSAPAAEPAAKAALAPLDAAGDAAKDHALAEGDADDVAPRAERTRQAPAPRAGLLTAGRWSDRDDWTRWQQLLAPGSSYHTMLDSWSVGRLDRVAVTVEGPSGVPADTEVVLHDDHGQLLWQARTDNRGRADLYLAPGRSAHLEVHGVGGEVLASRDVRAGEQHALRVRHDVSVASSLDLMFVVDTTGSMGDELSYLQTELADTVARVVFVVTDAPPHPGAGVGQSLQRTAALAARKGIRIVPVASSGVDKPTEFMLRHLAVSTGGTYVFLTDHSGIGNAHLEPTVGPYVVEPLSDLLVDVIHEYTKADGLRLAGSGSNLPLTRALSAAFPRGQGRYSVVHASIGSGGGIRALLDGVIDIALISRPLREGEREQGLVATPYARVPVVVAVHASVPDRAITRDQLVAIFDGSQRTWSSGAPVVVLQRERDDSSHWAIDRILPVFAAANEAAYRESRWRVLYRDDAMREALADTPGAIGLFGQGAIPPELPIEALTIDGVRPSVDAVRDGTYPFTKDFAFVTRGAPTGQARAFIDFVLSEPGRGIIEAAGALPLDGHLRTPAEEP